LLLGCWREADTVPDPLAIYSFIFVI